MPKNKNEDVRVWILGLETFRVIGIFNSQTQIFSVISINKFVTLTFQILKVGIFKLEPMEHGLLCCLIPMTKLIWLVVFSDTSHFPITIQRPPLHFLASSSSLIIVEALKLTKS